MLAGLLKAPSTTRRPTTWNARTTGPTSIVGLMEEQGYLTAAEADEARANPAQLSEAAAARVGRLLCRLGDGDAARLS